jgi:hypothetical protein
LAAGGTKTAVERGWSTPTNTAIASAASTTETQVVLPPLKLHATGNKIN